MPSYYCENKDGSVTEMDESSYRMAQSTCLAFWGTSFEQRVWDNDTEHLTIIMLQPTSVARIPGWRQHSDGG